MYIDSSRLMADNVALSEAIVKKDDKTISVILKHNMKTSGAQFITLADKDGKVIMRSHSSKRGDSITNQSVFRHAIQGQSCVNIERGTAIKFSLRAASPIYHDNKIIAAIVIGEALDTNRFVDNVKKITGLEMTIFEGNTRISTTLLNNGQRAIGTKLSNEKVLDAVLMRGETLTSNSILFDRPYKTVYWPLVDNFTHDKLGMWFIGLDHSMVQKTIDNIAFSCIVAIAIIFLVISIFGIVFSRALIVPLKKCVQFAINVANGSLKEELTVQRNDEVGELANALRTLLASLRTMIDEAQKATREAEEKNKLAEQATAEAKKAAVMAENAKRDGMLDAALKLDDMVTAISAAAGEAEQVFSLSSVPLIKARGGNHAASALYAVPEHGLLPCRFPAGVDHKAAAAVAGIAPDHQSNPGLFVSRDQNRDQLGRHNLSIWNLIVRVGLFDQGKKPPRARVGGIERKLIASAHDRSPLSNLSYHGFAASSKKVYNQSG